MATLCLENSTHSIQISRDFLVQEREFYETHQSALVQIRHRQYRSSGDNNLPIVGTRGEQQIHVEPKPSILDIGRR